MFGIDFSELVVIMVVAVIVIGPEQLPKVARTAGLLWGRLQRYVNGVKADVAREMEIDELRKIKEEAEQRARNLEQQIEQSGRDVMQTSSAQLAGEQGSPLQQTHEIIEEMERELFSSPNQPSSASEPPALSEPQTPSQPPAPNSK